MRTLYIVKRGNTVLLETLDLRAATKVANANGGYVEWWATY